MTLLFNKPVLKILLNGIKDACGYTHALSWMTTPPLKSSGLRGVFYT